MADIEVPHPGASEIITRLLSDAMGEHPDVQWLGLVSEDGFAIASEGAVSFNDDAVAAGAVRMMIEVRKMAKSLGQSGTSQLFLEGGDSGICVIDKDPWVLVVMGAPDVPIGLLRFEAREIAEAFPIGSRAALEAPEQDDEPEPTDWGTAAVDEQPAWDLDVEDTTVTDSDGEPEIRWADEPTEMDDAEGLATADSPDGHDIFGDAGLEVVEELEMPSTGADDLSDWVIDTPQPAAESMFDLAPAEQTPASFEMPAVVDETATSFDLPAEELPAFDLSPEPAVETPAEPESPFDLPAPVGPGFAQGFDSGFDEFADLPAPTGPAVDLPAPMGPAFELPPPQ